MFQIGRLADLVAVKCRQACALLAMSPMARREEMLSPNCILMDFKIETLLVGVEN
jgi:hypothetical protein